MVRANNGTEISHFLRIIHHSYSLHSAIILNIGFSILYQSSISRLAHFIRTHRDANTHARYKLATLLSFRIPGSLKIRPVARISSVGILFLGGGGLYTVNGNCCGYRWCMGLRFSAGAASSGAGAPAAPAPEPQAAENRSLTDAHRIGGHRVLCVKPLRPLRSQMF